MSTALNDDIANDFLVESSEIAAGLGEELLALERGASDPVRIGRTAFQRQQFLAETGGNLARLDQEVVGDVVVQCGAHGSLDAQSLQQRIDLVLGSNHLAVQAGNGGPAGPRIDLGSLTT